MQASVRSLVHRWLQGSALRHERFRRFYFGSIGTAFGYTMQATVAAWLMATLTPSALMVALVQTASTAPSLLFGLVAGTLADIVDRRRIVLSTQVPAAGQHAGPGGRDSRGPDRSSVAACADVPDRLGFHVLHARPASARQRSGPARRPAASRRARRSRVQRCASRRARHSPGRLPHGWARAVHCSRAHCSSC